MKGIQKGYVAELTWYIKQKKKHLEKSLGILSKQGQSKRTFLCLLNMLDWQLHWIPNYFFASPLRPNFPFPFLCFYVLLLILLLCIFVTERAKMRQKAFSFPSPSSSFSSFSRSPSSFSSSIFFDERASEQALTPRCFVLSLFLPARKSLSNNPIPFFLSFSRPLARVFLVRLQQFPSPPQGDNTDLPRLILKCSKTQIIVFYFFHTTLL